jgi:hypothetical protein
MIAYLSKQDRELVAVKAKVDSIKKYFESKKLYREAYSFEESFNNIFRVSNEPITMKKLYNGLSKLEKELKRLPIEMLREELPETEVLSLESLYKKEMAAIHNDLSVQNAKREEFEELVAF